MMRFVSLSVMAILLAGPLFADESAPPANTTALANQNAAAAQSQFFAAQQRGNHPVQRTQPVPMAVMNRSQPLRFAVKPIAKDSTAEAPASVQASSQPTANGMSSDQAKQILSIYGEVN